MPLPLPELPQEDLPSWLKFAALIVGGGAGARVLAIWLEHSRLKSKEYRETLLNRIRELEEVVAELQGSVADLRVENARLRERLSHDVDD